MTTTRSALAATIDAAAEAALDELLCRCRRRVRHGFSDSEWTGIAPILEEDIAMSSLAQDELGHARALYELLAEVRGDGQDSRHHRLRREPAEYRHARLLDHGRGRLGDDDREAVPLRHGRRQPTGGLATSSSHRSASSSDKIRREERYHVMHATTWLERLARYPGEPRDRLIASLDELAPDASNGRSRPSTRSTSRRSRRTRPSRWPPSRPAGGRRSGAVFVGLDLPMPPAGDLDGGGRPTASNSTGCGASTSVRRSDPGAIWLSTVAPLADVVDESPSGPPQRGSPTRRSRQISIVDLGIVHRARSGRTARSASSSCRLCRCPAMAELIRSVVGAAFGHSVRPIEVSVQLRGPVDVGSNSARKDGNDFVGPASPAGRHRCVRCPYCDSARVAMAASAADASAIVVASGASSSSDAMRRSRGSPG